MANTAKASRPKRTDKIVYRSKARLEELKKKMNGKNWKEQRCGHHYL